MKISTTKLFIFIVSILIITLIIAFIYKANELVEYSKNIYFMDKYVNVKIVTKNEIIANNIFDEVENIYNTYDNLINHKNDYLGNLYNLNNGSTSIDYRLYKIIEYGYTWYKKSNGFLNITNGNMDDVLINEVISDNENVLVDKSIILSNDVKLNLDNIAPGYINEVVAKYLKSKGINKYMINEGDNIYLGDAFKNKLYNIGIVNPNLDMIYKVIKGKNIAISNVSKNSNIIDINTPNKVSGVTVISNNSMDAVALANILYLMDSDSGLEFIKDYDAEVIWFNTDGSIVTTKGIINYE